MAYVIGSTVSISEFNTFLNTSKLVYGTGFGDSGYGQSSISLTNVSIGDSVSGSLWSSMRSAIVFVSNHQGTALATLPPSSVFLPTTVIAAEESSPPTSAPYDLDTAVAAISGSNRFNTNGGLSMSLVANAQVVTRATAWGSIATPILQTVVDTTWPSEDTARWFFNSGGEVRIKLTHPNGAGRNAHWHNLLNLIGTVSFKAHSTTLSGTLGAGSALGYYEMTNSNQTVYDIPPGSGYASVPYGGPHEVKVQAHRLNFLGVNGGNGSGVRFTVTLTENAPQITNYISSGTQFASDYLYATAVLQGIIAPTYVVQVPF